MSKSASIDVGTGTVPLREVSYSRSARIAVADSSPLYRNGVTMALNRVPARADVMEFDSVQSLFDQDAGADLLILDLQLRGLSEFQQLESLARNTPLLVMVDVASPTLVRNLFQRGSRGVVRKSVSLDILAQAVTAVLDGGYWHPARETRCWSLDSSREELLERVPRLSKQERLILRMISQGAMNKTIADQIGLSENTIKSHVSRIFRKFRVENRTKLVLTLQLLEAAGVNLANPDSSSSTDAQSLGRVQGF